jgi:general secretion pathway protein G
MSAYRTVRKSSKGFTLVEILIVVIILGILAAIVIPQFTSATTDARTNSAASLQNTVRSQLQLYRIQHNDQLPSSFTAVSAGSQAGAGTWSLMTSQTNADHTTTGTPTFGPYMQSTPVNPLNQMSTVYIVDSDSTAVGTASGFVLNTTTGKFWVTNAAGTAKLTP